jgi:hypothetical protein
MDSSRKTRFSAQLILKSEKKRSFQTQEKQAKVSFKLQGATLSMPTESHFNRSGFRDPMARLPSTPKCLTSITSLKQL